MSHESWRPISVIEMTAICHTVSGPNGLGKLPIPHVGIAVVIPNLHKPTFTPTQASLPTRKIYAGTVMSFYYAIVSAHGKWFQTNQPDRELDDRALLVCVTNL